ncbi:Hsp20/alpha crystallin family protein [Minwuia thermotolerans]|uniref:Glutamyl-tRNA amidotransferase n=1 Tax=Minwuia thermotolerans TaxID=2056226 RepID=A0A2M9FX01_9PROT|nr:Hsp20/alpha crystallin family protein [Minwuia thermotolerans]PJK27990.1 glutamyl-tRNA amidotransferase [Minwuia thermotolerans]
MVEKSETTPAGPDMWAQMMAPVRHLGRQVADLFAPSSEATGSDDAYEITVELPGVKDSDISVEVDDRRVTVSGKKDSSREEKDKSYYFSERVYGSFTRSFRVPDDADLDRIEATHTDGVLKISIPRRSKGPARRMIKVGKD